MGCFTAHDHIGKTSNFFLAVDFPDVGPRHDLGFEEALWLLVIAGIFFALRNRPFRPGFHVGFFALLYSPVRFGLDFLRNADLDGADIRYGGLTFAQWGCIAMMAAGAAVLAWIRTHHPLVDPNVPPEPAPA